MGKPQAIAVAILDMAKGGLVVGTAWAIGVRDPWILSLAGAAGVLGHNYPCGWASRGARGCHHLRGPLLLDWFNPWPALLGGAIWYGVMKATRYVSVASLVSLFSAAGLSSCSAPPAPYGITAPALALLSTWRHRANLASPGGGNGEPGGRRPVLEPFRPTLTCGPAVGPAFPGWSAWPSGPSWPPWTVPSSTCPSPPSPGSSAWVPGRRRR